MNRVRRIAATIVLVSLSAAACGGSDDPAAAPTTDPNGLPGPEVSAPPASEFVDRIDNPWYPLLPGSRFVYRGSEEGERLRAVVEVTSQTKTIAGVRCVVLHDNLYVDGELAESTSDWYAQDSDGNIWYFGEATAEFDGKGTVTSTEGSWETGVDGALPGLFMPADPEVGATYQQETFPGHAEDQATVVDLAASVEVPAVTSSEALKTEEINPLEPGVLGEKFYVHGIGLAKEETVQGGDELLELVSYSLGK